jgi:hypothetical protein
MGLDITQKHRLKNRKRGRDTSDVNAKPDDSPQQKPVETVSKEQNEDDEEEQDDEDDSFTSESEQGSISMR